MKLLSRIVLPLAVSAFAANPVIAEDLPGAGVTVSPIKGSPANAWFQHMVLQLGLEALGYEVEETLEADFPALHLAVASGDADYTFNHWMPLHNGFFDKSGGEAVMTRVNAAIKGAGQGYYIDKKTAEAHGITHIGQLADPALAAIFDSDGDGRANLSGCNPGWGCELAIETHLDDFDLRDTVQHDQGSYFAIMADTITRYNEGGAILYYTWTPNWISDVLVPGSDVVQIGVPSDDGFDAGFAVNDVYIVANNEFLEDNPAAAKLFELVDIPISAVNAAQVKLRDGENTVDDFRRHAADWIAANQAQFDGWIAEAKTAN
ncbi:glycine betaine/L-proline ABC transporter substrate-binding protein ProX [Mameliella sediminis]|uniref:glycine betaine/L-proline ABC transporter substrate-binding protein ProX n=1 Tax=Mameliella sediminis TaxID=2836866 RepID=UPI001C448595|nr:glycine betaine/L-proline ABC transporter substrate-binding protein ProX [Mameliella sediminis]MBV7396789.1 glycine betaine/L-proline ABC transporter substrate-binding protein ProX [Mameliella sediminis]